MQVDLVLRVRDALTDFRSRLLAHGSTVSDEERLALLRRACEDAGISEAQLAEALEAVPELAEFAALVLPF